ncbi:MAG TPA: SDR family NAD(P)-dependent oxidoreductase, partial [Ktedonobacteraceae bacterium]|nr:SDR family NAD(P)-dependent oxidoreductase [Ktedonobacteraceae bacterium]
MTERQQLPLSGKIALVTGSSQGIGRATALRLAQSGADIIINYRSNARTAQEVKACIEEMGRRCIAIQADVSQEEEVV